MSNLKVLNQQEVLCCYCVYSENVPSNDNLICLKHHTTEHYDGLVSCADSYKVRTCPDYELEVFGSLEGLE